MHGANYRKGTGQPYTRKEYIKGKPQIKIAKFHGGKRGDYDYIKAKSEEVFYDPKVATKEIVDEVFQSVNDRNKLVRTLAIAKSAIRHNMAKDLPNMQTRTAIIWGAQDSVTPPNVADEFNSLLPNSDLYWIDKCGHAPMMEHPDRFNEIMHSWMEKYNI